jgi:hypothetical protein
MVDFAGSLLRLALRLSLSSRWARLGLTPLNLAALLPLLTLPFVLASLRCAALCLTSLLLG